MAAEIGLRMATRGWIRLRLNRQLHGLRDAMAFNLGASVLRHEADDNSAHYRNHDDPQTESVESHADEIRRPAMVKAQISKQPDQFVQCEGD